MTKKQTLVDNLLGHLDNGETNLHRLTNRTLETLCDGMGIGKIKTAIRYTEGEFTTMGRTFKTFVFSSEDDANAFMLLNKNYGVLEATRDGSVIHLAEHADNGLPVIRWKNTGVGVKEVPSLSNSHTRFKHSEAKARVVQFECPRCRATTEGWSGYAKACTNCRAVGVPDRMMHEVKRNVQYKCPKCTEGGAGPPGSNYKCHRCKDGTIMTEMPSPYRKDRNE